VPTHNRTRTPGGAAHLTWNGKLHARAAAPGVYKLTVIASSAGIRTRSTVMVELR
jgi:hypothetical protein